MCRTSMSSPVALDKHNFAFSLLEAVHALLFVPFSMQPATGVSVCLCSNRYMSGVTRTAETSGAGVTQVHVYYDEIPGSLEAPDTGRRVKWVFLASFSSTYERAQTYYNSGLIYNNVLLVFLCDCL